MIAQTLYYSKNVESFGTGLRRIADACDEAGCNYKFDVLKSGFVVTFYREVVADEDNLGGNPQAEPQAAIQNQIQIYCSHPRSKADIAEHCGYKDVKYFAEQYLKPMLENGILEMTIPDKPISPNQKYVTVDANR